MMPFVYTCYAYMIYYTQLVSNVIYDSMLHYFQATFPKQVTHIIFSPSELSETARYQVCNGPLASPIAKLTVMLGMEKNKRQTHQMKVVCFIYF